MKSNLTKQYKFFKENGYVHLKGVVDKSLIPLYIDAINNCKPFGYDTYEEDLKHFKCVFNRDKTFIDFLDHPKVIPLIYALLGKTSHIIGMTAWRSSPGWGTKYLHVDDILVKGIDSRLLLDGTVVIPPHIITAHFYLNDITQECCPTYIIPKSHLAGREPKVVGTELADGTTVGLYETSFNGHSEFPVLAKAGDVLLFRSDIWHGGSTNVSDKDRYLLQTHYATRNIAQRFSPYTKFVYNKEILDGCTEEQQRLLGKHRQSYYD